ncbi:hypothetical protein [Halorubrum sp. DTA46]|uniref:hypothetical protein n=1 Tax=Halorubrum sp. DTA46 TaxID=3402162 RepID=UPI003AAB0D3C
MPAWKKPFVASKSIGEVLLAKGRHYKYRLRWGSNAPRPYQVVWVDPARIDRCTLPSLMGQLDLSPYGSHVVGGDWDRRERHDEVWYTRAFDPPVIASFTDHELYRSMRAHFLDGVPWEDTEWYRWIRSNQHTVGQYATTEMMDDRLTAVDELYERIRTEGYKTQRELATERDVPLSGSTFPCPEHYEIDINVGRDGELFFNFNGRHRLAIAKILDVPEIPVRVFARHTSFQSENVPAIGQSSDFDRP